MAVNWGNKNYYVPRIEAGGLYYYSNYPKLCIKDSSVVVDSLVDEMEPLLVSLSEVAALNGVGAFMITSGNDSTKHCKGSYHYKNRAIDISFRDGTTGTQISGIGKGGSVLNSIRYTVNAAAKRYWVLLEGDHIHIEYNPSKAGYSELEDVSVRDGGSTQDDEVYTPKTSYFLYMNDDLDVNTVDELIDKKGSILNGYEALGRTRDEWIDEIKNFNGGTGLTNEEFLSGQYIEIDGEKLNEWPDFPLGSVIMIPSYEVLRDLTSLQGNSQEVALRDLPLYLDSYLKAMSDNKYYRRNKEIDSETSESYGTLYAVENVDNNLSVWIFCKADNQIHDVTHLCTSVYFSSGTGDSFNMNLVFTRDDDLENNDSNDYAQSFSHPVFRTDISHNLSTLSALVSENDIVFIRFENLDIELDPENKGEKKRVASYDFIVPLSELAGNYYDFIGLVSNVNQVRDIEQGVGTVSISGDSLRKLFTQDEAIFMPIAAVSEEYGGNLVLGGSNSDGVKRTFVNGELAFLFAKTYRSLENTMKFFMNCLASTGFVPDDNESLFSSYSNINGEDRRTYLNDISYEGRFVNVSGKLAKGIYQIVKLSIDPALEKRYLLDSSVTNPSGTIMSLFNKVCAAPLVELLMDTYGDEFVVTCRVPPFAKEQVLQYVYAGKRDEDYYDENDREYDERTQNGANYRTVSYNGVDYTFGEIAPASIVEAVNYIIVIKKDSVEMENLSWETDFYTWYTIQMTGSWLGGTNSTILSYIPVLYLNEYFDRWGSKRMNIVTPYSCSPGNVGDIADRTQAVADMLYCVESTAYLPFTRRGTISLNRGDRRIKKGMWVLYEFTNEIFYVDSVEQSYSISDNNIVRKTILNVSRGMVKDYLENSEYNYFNIVDLDGLKDMLDEFAENCKANVKSSLRVNKDVFDFFLARKQFL